MIDEHKLAMDNCANTTHSHGHVHLFRRISWTAVFVGALVAVGLGFLLNLFGLAIGLTMFNINNQGSMVLAFGGLLGVIIGVIVAMTVAGFTAGFLGRNYCPNRNLGILYGFTTWTVALLLSAVITAHVGNYVTAYTNRLTNSMVVASVNTNPNADMVEISGTSNNSANDVGDQQVVKVTASTHTIAWSAFVIFLLFLIGAISACVGACWGMTCKCVD